MNPLRRLSFVALFFCCSASSIAENLNGQDTKRESIKIDLQECTKFRPQARIGSVMAAMAQSSDKLVRRGTIQVEGTNVDIYLPRLGRKEIYSTKNSSDDNTRFGNTSTYISIDQNSDGELSEYEAAPVNLPIRIHDSMYQVTGIAEDGSSLTLEALENDKLFGVVLNRRCPDFSFLSVDGKSVTNQSILGMVTILDIWAVT